MQLRYLLLVFISLNVKMLIANDSKEIAAYRIPEGAEFNLDGKVNEVIWMDIDPVRLFTMQVPVEGGDPTEDSEVRIAYDANNLYIGIIFFDDNPEDIKAFQRRRDNPLFTDDRFSFILDTFLDKRNAYFFEINPAGLMGDGLLTIGQGTNLNMDWDGIWRAWTHIGDFGWSAEIRIPFRSLNFDINSEIWGINFQRTIRRKNEERLWSGYRRGQGLLRPQNAGTLTGLKDLSQGIGLEVVPYGIVQRREERAPESEGGGLETDWEVDGGGEINYNITPGLKASFTYNTDFAEAEVDSRQVNLTRFPLFFPEQRDFFLESASIYEFAPSSGIDPYFSRRIGLRNGQSIPINYGGRVIGREGDYNMALLHVRTSEKDTIQPEDFTVARVKKNIFKESSIGLIYTRRSTKNGEELPVPLQDRHTIGADLEMNTSTFLGNKNFQFQSFFVYHNDPNALNDTTDFWDVTSRGLRLNFPNKPFSGHVSYREFGNAFDPAVGFTPRNAFRRVQPSMDFNPLFEQSDIIRDINWGIRFEHLMDLDWELLTQELRFELFEVTLESADRLELAVRRSFERLVQPFDIKGDETVILPVDDYTNWETQVEFETASYRRLVLLAEFTKGGFWSGDRTEWFLALTLRPLPGINLITEYLHSDNNLEEGDFDTDLVRFNANFDFTPWVTFSTRVQFDNLSELLGINNRFRWTIKPGTDIFLVYNHGWLNQEDRFITRDSKATLKATYTHRF